MRVTIVVTAPIATFEQKKAKESESATLPQRAYPRASASYTMTFSKNGLQVSTNRLWSGQSVW